MIRSGGARVALAGVVALGAFGWLVGSPGPASALVTLLANDDSLTVSHADVAVVAAPGVLANDVTVLGTTAKLDAGPSHGTVQLATNGGYRYTPKAGFVGSDSFTYHDTGILPSNTATVSISVTNATPVANDDVYAATTGVQLSVHPPGVLANDRDGDGDHLQVRLVDGSGNGSLSLAADGGFNFKSGGSFSGIRTFTYQVGDGIVWSAVATVTINVQPKGGSTPLPSATPAPTPTPSPTPVPTPTPTAMPTLPLPSLPVPTIPLPTLPLPTLFPTPTPDARPTPIPSAEPSRSPQASAQPVASDPPASPGDSPAPSNAAVVGGTTGGGDGASGPTGGSAGGGSANDVHVGGPGAASAPIAGLADLGVVGLGGLIEWAVPSLALTVPGLIVILAVIAQAVAAGLWLPFIRRWLGELGDRRRRPSRSATG